MIPEKFPVEIVVSPESAETRALVHRFPETQRLLFLDGLPKNFLGPLYSAAERLTIVEVPPVGRLIRFGGSTNFSDGLFINPDTGEVVDVGLGKVRSFVNSSLEQFGQTAVAVMGRFPFYSGDAEYEETDRNIDAAVTELSAIISNIDPQAMGIDLFWSTFVDDVGIGDFATEDVLDLPRQ